MKLEIKVVARVYIRYKQAVSDLYRVKRKPNVKDLDQLKCTYKLLLLYIKLMLFLMDGIHILDHLIMLVHLHFPYFFIPFLRKLSSDL